MTPRTEEGTSPNETTPFIVRAETPAYGGYVIGRDGKVIFIKGAIPGELVEVSIEERKRDYVMASVKQVIEPSPFRRTPPCPVFGICGGCHVQFLDYDKQIAYKEEILVETLKRIGDSDIALMPSLVDREFGYRHRGQFKVSRDGSVGFYRAGTRDVVAVDACPLMIDRINDVLRSLRPFDIRGMKEMHITAGDTVTLLIKGFLEEGVAGEMLGTGIAGIAFENGDSIGKDYVTLELNSLKYSVTPWGFFQSNWAVNKSMVRTVVEQLSPLNGMRILDLYAGAGNFSLPLSLHAQEVISIEENQYAVEDGKRNAALNSIKNCSFFHASVEQSFGDRKKKQMGRLFGDQKYDVIILDPPRSGLTSFCLEKILELGCMRIVYVSCNPATLARDIKKMKDRYEIESVYMADLFPNTYHIETLAFLNLKGS